MSSSERSQVRSTSSPQGPARRSRLARWAVAPIGLAVSLILAGCTQEQTLGWLPTEPGTTNHVDRVIGLWTTSWIVLLIVGGITWGLILWAAIVYRRRKGQTGLPVQMRYNMPIEVFYTIVPFVLVLGFFAFTARDQAAIEADFGDEQPDVRVEAFGKRWGWDFNYLNEDVYFSGEQLQPNASGEYDPETMPVLYLPVDQKVEIKLESRDVVHSFWVIDFLYKKDMIPAKTNYMYFVPLKEGTYRGKCAELCGEYHADMLFEVRVVSQAEYDSQMEALRAAGNTGVLGAEYNVNQNLPGNGSTDKD
ncbi:MULTISPECIES: cytochrome c oxidase subunit II [unclassified Salinibacterium]|uniref:aa3-type cytochrome oxidase subunit II n=1 Tax=unclassified Salinibacterium TaxID=2632331 RepID=UPI001421F92F|nr:MULTISPECIES: cytochrome c oxidase subunit II [unclassified Salinibacterium]